MKNNQEEVMKLVPPGKVPAFAYVHQNDIRFRDASGMSVEMVNHYVDRLKNLDGCQHVPMNMAPLGHWSDGSFWIEDGRHRTVAFRIAGYDYVLVFWWEDA